MNLPEWYRIPGAFSSLGCISNDPEQILPAYPHLITIPAMSQHAKPHYCIGIVLQRPQTKLNSPQLQIRISVNKIYTTATHWKIKPHMNHTRNI